MTSDRIIRLKTFTRQEEKMVKNDDRERRMAIMAIKENTPKQVEAEILNLIENGYKLNDLRKSGYSEHLAR